MTATPNRAAADEAIEGIRSVLQTQPASSEKARIVQRLEVEVTTAVLGAMADLMDLDAGFDEIGANVVVALSGGLGTYLLTESQGDRTQATKVGKKLIGILESETRRRIETSGSDLVVGGLGDAPAAGKG